MRRLKTVQSSSFTNIPSTKPSTVPVPITGLVDTEILSIYHSAEVTTIFKLYQIKIIIN